VLAAVSRGAVLVSVVGGEGVRAEIKRKIIHVGHIIHSCA